MQRGLKLAGAQFKRAANIQLKIKTYRGLISPKAQSKVWARLARNYILIISKPLNEPRRLNVRSRGCPRNSGVSNARTQRQLVSKRKVSNGNQKKRRKRQQGKKCRREKKTRWWLKQARVGQRMCKGKKIIPKEKQNTAGMVLFSCPRDIIS
ncbi:unnamed protein product [Clavelina lepadiformis]|uniref:Uncharacterized protein n=1 Tax=Clavelina lepadiformis TaxID=159417 RepID=A0ABP0G7X6_CLALP